MDELSYWLFTIPNFLLAAAMYTIVGRYFLALVFGNRNDAVILRVFNQVTDPVLKAIRAVTPLYVPNGFLLILSVFWLLLLRILLFVVALMLGFAPKPEV